MSLLTKTIVGVVGNIKYGGLDEVTPADPVTLAIVVCALAGATACATYVPARRAAGVDPSEALRAE